MTDKRQPGVLPAFMFRRAIELRNRFSGSPTPHIVATRFMKRSNRAGRGSRASKQK
jgi:hypothetical protein